jgi:hypothetical protein
MRKMRRNEEEKGNEEEKRNQREEEIRKKIMHELGREEERKG